MKRLRTRVLYCCIFPMALDREWSSLPEFGDSETAWMNVPRRAAEEAARHARESERLAREEAERLARQEAVRERLGRSNAA